MKIDKIFSLTSEIIPLSLFPGGKKIKIRRVSGTLRFLNRVGKTGSGRAGASPKMTSYTVGMAGA